MCIRDSVRTTATPGPAVDVPAASPGAAARAAAPPINPTVKANAAKAKILLISALLPHVFGEGLPPLLSMTQTRQQNRFLRAC